MKQKMRFLITIIVLIGFHSSVISKPIPIVKKAVLDLRDWDFKKDGAVKLDGEWAFYWEKLMTPADFKNNPKPDLFITVPDKWEKYSIHNKMLPINGYATYRLKILIRKTKKELKLSLPYPIIPTVCFINGEKIGYNGVVGTDAKSTVHEYKFCYNNFYITGDTIDVIIQIANYEYEKGGLCFNVTLGESRIEERKLKIENVMDIFFLGCVFLMSIYHIIIFFLRYKDKSPLYLSLFCLGIGFLFTITNNDFNSLLDIGFDYRTILYLSLIPFCLTYAGYFLFVYHLFPKEFTKRGIWIVLTICLLNYLFCALKYSLGMFLEQFLRSLRILALLYSFIVVVIAVIKKREDSILFLIGLSIVVAGAVIDILIQLNQINITSPLQMSILGLFLMQAFIVARRFSREYYRNEKLTEELFYVNENLENLVIKRTETIERQNETLVQLNKTKDRLFAIIGHDLRSPLGSLEGITNVIGSLVNQNKFDTLKQVTGQIEISVKRMTSLLDNLLKWSFMQTKQIRFNPQRIDVHEMVESACELLQPVADSKNITITSYTKAGMFISADENLLKTVFRNLISNAIKFSNTNGHIEIDTEYTMLHIIISVKDSGVGIDQEKIATLFEIDENKISIGTNKERGTGLGLVLCKEFVEMHKGEISLDTQKDVGTTFYVKLPLEMINE